jgi:hypothetical protein
VRALAFTLCLFSNEVRELVYILMAGHGGPVGVLREVYALALLILLVERYCSSFSWGFRIAIPYESKQLLSTVYFSK